MKKGFSIRTKFEAGVLIFLLCITVVSGTITLKYGTDSSGLTWIGAGEEGQYPAPYDYIIRQNSTHVFAVNCNTSEVQWSSDTPDISDMLNNCCDEIYNRSSNNQGGTIYISTGQYEAYDPIWLTPGIVILGSSGMRSNDIAGTFIKSYVSASEKYLFSYDDTCFGSPGGSVTIKDISFGEYSGTTEAMIYIKQGVHHIFSGLLMAYTSGDGFLQTGIHCLGAQNVWVHNCVFTQCSEVGLNLSTINSPFLPCNAAQIDDSRFHNNYGDGMLIERGTTAVTIRDSTFEGNGGHGLVLGEEYLNEVGTTNCLIEGCYFENNALNGTKIYGCEYTTIKDCFYNEGTNPPGIDMNYPADYEYFHKHNTIENCHFQPSDEPLILRGNFTTVRNVKCDGIRGIEGHHMLIENVNITGDDSELINWGINIDNTNCEYAQVRRCRVEYTNRSGIYAYGTGSIIESCYVSNVCNGADTIAVYGHNVVNNYIDGVGCSQSLRVGNAGSLVSGNTIKTEPFYSYSQGAVINNNYFDYNDADSLLLWIFNSDQSIKGNTFDQSGMTVYTQVYHNTLIDGNNFFNCVENGIVLLNGQDITITDNIITGDASGSPAYAIHVEAQTADCEEIKISGNTIAEFTSTGDIGIYLNDTDSNNIHNVIISDNYIYGCQTPLDVDSECYNITIFDNLFNCTNNPSISASTFKMYDNLGYDYANWMVLPTIAPANPVTGSCYFNPSDNKIYVYDGGWLSTSALT